MNAVDTNVLIDAQDPRDLGKQQIANTLVDNLADAILLWQVACEYIAASRKLVPYGFSVDEAWKDIEALRSGWQTAVPNWNVYERGHDLMSKEGFSSWDALLVAGCIEAGVKTLYSEDLGDRPSVTGLSFINPFTESG